MEGTKEFVIGVNGKEETFKFDKVSPVKLSAIMMSLDLDDPTKSEALITLAVESCKVKINDKWAPVKMPGKEVYMPFGIENDIEAFLGIAKEFLDQKVTNSFTKSSG
jgi:hypothetical protein